MSDRKDEPAWHDHYRRGLGTALRHNQVAYSYSAMTTALFGVLQHDKAGGPDLTQAFLFVVGAGVAFAVVNAAVTHWFSERLPREPSEVVALGTAISVFSMAAGLGIGALVGWAAPPGVAWPVAPLAASIGFILLSGLEMGLAGYTHEAGGHGGEFDEG
jgi:MFS family permease